jgi:DNA-binding NtrC family response regulator
LNVAAEYGLSAVALPAEALPAGICTRPHEDATVVFLAGATNAVARATVDAKTTFTLEEVRRDCIARAFRESGGVVSATATRLGIPRTTLNAMMTKLVIKRSDFLTPAESA